MGIKDLIKMNDEQPTPETDAAIDDSPYYQSRFVMVAADLARKLERGRDETREQLEAMREAIKEALVELSTKDGHGCCVFAKAAIDKLQPFIKP